MRYVAYIFFFFWYKFWKNQNLIFLDSFPGVGFGNVSLDFGNIDEFRKKQKLEIFVAFGCGRIEGFTRRVRDSLRLWVLLDVLLQKQDFMTADLNVCIYLLSMYVHAHMYHGVCVEATGHLRELVLSFCHVDSKD